MVGRPQSALLSIAIVLAAVTVVHGDVQFLEVGTDRGIGPYTMAPGLGGGVAAADFDDDGDIDLFVPNDAGVPDQLYRNLGNGQFEEIAAAAGVASLQRGRVALWFDYDGDHRLDLFVAGDCKAPADAGCPGVSTLKLYRQIADAQFEDVTLAAGFVDDLVNAVGSVERGGMAAGDVNGDGRLDLLISLWFGSARLFLNNGDGTFSDVSASSGITAGGMGHWQPVMHDFDGDGRQDIYHAIDFASNKLWINQGDGTFEDVAPTAGADNAWSDMGLTLGDYDNDGDLDIYVTNIQTETRHNILLRNDSSGTSLQLTEVSQQAGVAEGGWGWGATFFDADNDGDLDLAATNGANAPDYTNDPSKFFVNVGGDPVTFADMSNPSGFNDTLMGSSLNALDFDRDGDLDLVQTCNDLDLQPSALRLMENQRSGAAASNHHLVIRPRMFGTNSRAIGAVVRARAGSLEMMRLITAGTSFLGQEPAEAFFGLGSATAVDEVIIDWPGGTTSSHRDVAADQLLLIVPPLTLTLDEDTLVWEHAGGGPGIAYDVVRGDLGLLRATGGDFEQAVTGCVADDLPASSWSDAEQPLSGEGLWYLVREVSPSGAGSWDEQSGSQLGSRDPEIELAVTACP